MSTHHTHFTLDGKSVQDMNGKTYRTEKRYPMDEGLPPFGNSGDALRFKFNGMWVKWLSLPGPGFAAVTHWKMINPFKLSQRP